MLLRAKYSAIVNSRADEHPELRRAQDPLKETLEARLTRISDRFRVRLASRAPSGVVDGVCCCCWCPVIDCVVRSSKAPLKLLISQHEQI